MIWYQLRIAVLLVIFKNRVFTSAEINVTYIIKSRVCTTSTAYFIPILSAVTELRINSKTSKTNRAKDLKFSDYSS